MLVNFDSQPVAGEIRVPLECLPEAVREKAAVAGVFPLSPKAPAAATVRAGALCMPVSLEPFEFGVLVVRQPAGPWPKVDTPRAAAGSREFGAGGRLRPQRPPGRGWCRSRAESAARPATPLAGLD